MRRSFVVGVDEHLDGTVGAADADEGPSRLRAYSGQGLQSLGPLQRPSGFPNIIG